MILRHQALASWMVRSCGQSWWDSLKGYRWSKVLQVSQTRQFRRLYYWPDILGTGKSFIGALLAKVLHDQTNQPILVVCFTNHALDQFIEDLINIGIPKRHLVRLGGRASPQMEELTIMKQEKILRFGRLDWSVIDALKVHTYFWVCFHHQRFSCDIGIIPWYAVFWSIGTNEYKPVFLCEVFIHAYR